MKVKKFNNLWAMGLILCGVLLVAFYVAKIFFAEFIVGVAEIPAIVNFGNFIDGNIVFRNIFDFLSNILITGIYFCACCRVSKLNLKAFLVLVCYALVLRLCSNFFTGLYSVFNLGGLVFCPLIICLLNNNANKDTFISTVICFSVDSITQVLSMIIRDITLIANTLNTATYTVLLIDMIIWRVLLYCYYNYKKGE